MTPTPSRAPAAAAWLAWLVLLAWLGLQPLRGAYSEHLWEMHLGVAAALAAVAALRQWSTPSVVAGPPLFATVLAVVSLRLAMAAAEGRFAAAEMERAADVGLAHALFFLAVLGLAPGRDDEDGSRAWARALLVLLAVFVAGQLVWMALDVGDDPMLRPSGTMGNPNALGATLGASGLALAALLRWRPAALVMLAAVGAATLATRSRGAAASIALVGLVFLWRRWGWRAFATVTAVAVLALLVPNPLRERLLALQSDHVFSRPFIWGRALAAAWEQPLGIGPGNFKWVFAASALDPGHPWLLHQRHAVGLTHNALLTLVVEWGWLAGASALALAAWGAARLVRRGTVDPLLQAATLGAAVLFVEMQVDGTEQNRLVLSLFLLLLATALARTGRLGPGPAVPGRLAAAGAMAAALLLGGEVAAQRRVNQGLASAEQVVAAARQGEATVGAVRSAFAAVTSQWPDEPRAWKAWLQFERERVRALLGAPGAVPALGAVDGGLAGGADAAPGDAAAALDAAVDAAMAAADRALEACAAVDPADPAPLADGARFALMLHRRLGPVRGEAFAAAQLERMLRLGRQALQRDPLEVELRFELGRHAHVAGLPAERDALFDELLALEPDHAAAWLWRARVAEAEGDREAALHAWVRCDEALADAAIQLRIDNPDSRRFYEHACADVDPAVVRAAIVRLRRDLYF